MHLRLLAAMLILAIAIDANPSRLRRAIGFDCSNKVDGDYADPWAQCSSTFYKCSALGPTIQTCSTGTAYDPTLRICNWIASIPECKSTLATPPTTPQTTTTPSTTTVQSNPTSTTPSGLLSFSCNQNPSASNSSLFFDCFQIPNLRASLLAFDCIQRPGAKEDLSVFDCFQKTIGGGNAAPIPLECRRMSLEAFSCSFTSGLGIGFDCRASGQRTSPSDPLAFGCAQKISASTPSTTTKQADVPQFDCIGKPSGNYPMGACENHFWQCSNNVAFKMPCATLQQRYNPINDRCLDPVDVPGCRIAGRRRRETIDTPFSCYGKPNGDYATPDNKCAKYFFKCASGKGTLEWCPADLLFDPYLRVCNYQHLVLC